MTNFILDDTDLTEEKSDLFPVPAGLESQYLDAEDWNTSRQALLDIKDVIVAVTSDPNGTVSGLRGALALDKTNGGVYQNTDGGTTWQAVGAGLSSDTYDLHNVVDDYGADYLGVVDPTTAINNAITAAKAAYTSTSRTQVIYFPGGVYRVQSRLAIRQFDLNAATGIRFLGTPGGRSRIIMQGNSALSDWYLFQTRGSSTNIEFRDLVFEMGTLTNPDPSEQNHLIQVGDTCSRIRFYDCELRSAVGDGIRLLGGFGANVDYVYIGRCKFYECGRASVSFQRWVRGVTIEGCIFEGGHDSQIDSEPTGTTLTADADSTATVVSVDGPPAAAFTTYGLKAGDLAVNTTEFNIVKVASVDSDTQITTTSGVTSWSGDTITFPRSQWSNVIVNNRFIRGSNTVDILVTLANQNNCLFAHNHLEGCLQAGNIRFSMIANNSFDNRDGTAYTPLIQLIQDVRSTFLVGNTLWARTSASPVTTTLKAIHISDQTAQPMDVTVANNNIYLMTRATGIHASTSKRSFIYGNTIILNTPGETGQSLGIHTGSLGTLSVDSATIVNNVIRADAGRFNKGIQVVASGTTVGTVIINGNTVLDSDEPIDLPESVGGTFTNPPLMGSNACGEGQLTEPPSLPWIQMAGIGGSAPTTNSRKPAIYWGTGSPEGVLAAGVGSMAMRRDGGAGTSLYIKESGTGNTGWVAK